jgi:predicted secreted acid phosphatase
MTTSSAIDGAPSVDAAPSPEPVAVAPSMPSPDSIALAALRQEMAQRLTEIEAYKPLANRWRAYEEAESKRLDSEAAALPEAVRAIYAKQGDVDAKREILAAFRSTSTASPKVVGVPPSMGAPPAVSVVDFDEALSDVTGKKAAEAKARDPQGWSAWLASKMSGRSSSSASLGVGRFARSKAQ